MALSAARATCQILQDAMFVSESTLSSLRSGWEFDWQEIIALCNRQFITPTLAWCLVEHHAKDAMLDEDVREFFKSALWLNTRRNRQAIEQVLEISNALKGGGIAHAYLKGCALLLGESSLFRASRLLADIDILVDPAGINQAVELMKGLGYRYQPEDMKPNHHVLPCFSHDQKVFGIELHFAIGSDPGLPTSQELLNRRYEVDSYDREVPILDTTDRMFHAFYHSQIADRRHMFGQLPLRSLIDFIGIWSSHRDEIDWNRLDHLATNLAASHEYACYLLLADAFFSMGLRRDRPSLAERCFLERVKVQACSDWLDTVVLWAVSLTVPLHWRRFARRAGAHQGGKFPRTARILDVLRELKERRLGAIKELIDSSRRMVKKYKAGF